MVPLPCSGSAPQPLQGRPVWPVPGGRQVPMFGGEEVGELVRLWEEDRAQARREVRLHREDENEDD